jgi:hypothetical protein
MLTERDIVQVVSCNPLIAEASVQNQTGPCGFAVDKCHWTGLSPGASFLPRRYHSPKTLCSFTHPPLTLHNLSS